MASTSSQREPSSLGTFLLGIVCLAIFAAIIVFWTKSTAPKTDLVEAERGAARLQKRLDLEKEWASKLQTVAWVNKEKGEVQVPIEEAMKAVVSDLQAKQVAKSAVKVPAIVPPPPVDPKSTEPPPPLMPSAPQGADLIHFPTPAPATAPRETPAQTPAPSTPPPAPTPASAPAAPLPPTPAPLPVAPALPAPAAAEARPPLINWTESK